MKLLLLTPQLPYPARQGTTIRNYNLIRELAQRHTVDLLTFLAPGDTLDANSPLHQLCRQIGALPQPVRAATQRVFDTLRSPLPDMALRLKSAAMHDLVQCWVQATQYELVQIEGIEMAQYGLRAVGKADDKLTPTYSRGGQVDQGQTAGRPVLIFDDHNCEYLLQKRNALTDLGLPQRWAAAAYSLVQWQKLVRYETHICRQADAVLAVSAADKAALADLVPDKAITVVSNGIRVRDYNETQSVRPQTSRPGQRNLVFTGKMDYRPNIDAVLWFGRQVLPLIQAQKPEVCFQIVGMNPHPRLDALRANPAIEVVGAVADAQPYIQNAAVYVIPMRVGGGTRFKALEAMAWAKPIVSTTLGVEGIPVQNGQELLLADSPQAFAAAVVGLLNDAQAGATVNRQLGEQARRFVEDHYDWAQIMPDLEEAYAKARQVRA